MHALFRLNVSNICNWFIFSTADLEFKVTVLCPRDSNAASQGGSGFNMITINDEIYSQYILKRG